MKNLSKFQKITLIFAIIVTISSILDIDFNQFIWKDLLIPIAMIFLSISIISSNKESKENDR